MLIDTHAHLNDERLLTDVDSIVQSMVEDGLSKIITVAYDYESSKINKELCSKYDRLYYTVGVHPHDSKTYSSEIADYIYDAVKTDKKCVAVGEIGLDYYYDLSERSVQKRVFVEQLDLAHSLRIPVAIHLRDAYGDMVELLKTNRDKLKDGVILHCYSGSKELVKEFSKYDMFYSFGGAITFKNATEKPEVIRAIPRDRIMLETDCPYMTPVPFRGKTNLPKYVNLVADKLAEIWGVDRAEVEELTTHNANTLFTRLV